MIKLTPKVITGLVTTLLGDEDKAPKAPYMSGPNLVEFFNELGFDEEYSWSGGFPARKDYAADKIRILNGTARIKDCILAIVDPVRFIDSEFSIEAATEHVNSYLKFNGLEVVQTPEGNYLKETGKAVVDFNRSLSATTPNLETFIDEQMKKCDQKLANGDYDGAITNARSLVESTLFDLENRITGKTSRFDGDLLKLFKRVKRALSMDDKKFAENEAILQLLRGLAGVVSGLAGTSNSMGDRHAQSSQPRKHHAQLCVNAAKTISDFMVSSYLYQVSTGTFKSSP